MKIIKKLFLGALCAGLLSVPSTLEKVEAADQPAILYLKPNSNWTKDGARFAAYFFGNGETWVSMKDTDGDGIQEVNVPTEKIYPSVIFCRMNGGASANNWNNKWNQTGDLTIPTNGNDLFTLSSSVWDGATATWSKFTPKYEAHKLTIVGSMQGWNEKEEVYMKDDSKNHVYSYELNLAPGKHSFKIVENNSWDTNFGYTATTKKGIELTNDADDNFVFSTLGGTYNFVYDYKNTTLTVEEKSIYEINKVFDHYYNNGTYTKVSELKVNEIAQNEVAKYFHADQTVRWRKTEYTTNGLSMTTSNDNNNYSTEASVYTNTTDGKVQHTGVGGNYTVNWKSVEEKFVTLYDFKNSTDTAWKLENGTYTYSLTSTKDDLIEAEMTRMAREFVAPMWLAPTANNWAYAQFTKLTVQVIDGNLVMNLYVNNPTITDNANGLFSQVTIY